MPSPKAKSPGRSSGGSPVLGSSNGRFEFMSLTKPLNRSSPPHLPRQGSDPNTARLRASESPSRRRGSSSSTGSASGQGGPEEDGIRLNPSFIRVALDSLLAIDLWLSKSLGVCAYEDSSWGSVRPLMKLIEISGHGIPWLAGTAYSMYKSDSAAGQEVMLNLFMGKSTLLFVATVSSAVAFVSKETAELSIVAAAGPGFILHFLLKKSNHNHFCEFPSSALQTLTCRCHLSFILVYLRLSVFIFPAHVSASPVICFPCLCQKAYRSAGETGD